MKKVGLVFAVAVFVPSLVLAWLAVRSLRDQQFVLERQQSLLFQGVTDSLAKQAADSLDLRQSKFGAMVEEMYSQPPAGSVTKSFDTQLRAKWSVVEVGFVVTLSGNIVCPSPPAVRRRKHSATTMAGSSPAGKARRSIGIPASKQTMP